MHTLIILVLVGLIGVANGTLRGPFLIWGQDNLYDLKVSTLAGAPENHTTLFQKAKAVIVFLKNSTNRFNLENFPKFSQYIRNSSWVYLPKYSLPVEPFNCNANVKVILLSGPAVRVEEELMRSYENGISIYGKDEVLGILANSEEKAHLLSKRDKEEVENDVLNSTTSQMPPSEDADQSKIYLADGNKAVLHVNEFLVLNIHSLEESLKLKEHNKAITFDDQRIKGYGRLNVIFNIAGEKVFLRFNFTLSRGTWSVKAVEIEYKKYKNVFPVMGDAYSVPSAPIGFSYRCSTRPLLFKHGVDNLVINDFQIQPWLNEASKFGDVYDCVGFTTAAIWAGMLVSFFFLGILSIGTIALMDIKTPNRFESTRCKQLTFTVQD